jgi:hypothetical protein
MKAKKKEKKTTKQAPTLKDLTTKSSPKGGTIGSTSGGAGGGKIGFNGIP